MSRQAARSCDVLHTSCVRRRIPVEFRARVELVQAFRTTQRGCRMMTRFVVGVVTAMLMAPALHAGPVSGHDTSHLPWESLAQAALEAICRNFDLCLVSMP